LESVPIFPSKPYSLWECFSSSYHRHGAMAGIHLQVSLGTLLLGLPVCQVAMRGGSVAQR